jgi:hypothetical protein
MMKIEKKQLPKFIIMIILSILCFGGAIFFLVHYFYS